MAQTFAPTVHSVDAKFKVLVPWTIKGMRKKTKSENSTRLKLFICEMNFVRRICFGMVFARFALCTPDIQSRRQMTVGARKIRYTRCSLLSLARDIYLSNANYGICIRSVCRYVAACTLCTRHNILCAHGDLSTLYFYG